MFVFTEVRTSSFVFYDWYTHFSCMRRPLMQDKVVAYAEKLSSTGKKIGQKLILTWLHKVIT